MGQSGDLSAVRVHSLVQQLLTYIRSNRTAIVNYGARYRSGRDRNKSCGVCGQFCGGKANGQKPTNALVVEGRPSDAAGESGDDQWQPSAAAPRAARYPKIAPPGVPSTRATTAQSCLKPRQFTGPTGSARGGILAHPGGKGAATISCFTRSPSRRKRPAQSDHRLLPSRIRHRVIVLPARPLWLGGTNLVSAALLDWFQGALCWKIGHKGALRKNCRFRHQAGVFGSQITMSADESGHHPGEGTNDEDRSNGNDIRCSFSWSLPSHGAAVWVGLCRRWK